MLTNLTVTVHMVLIQKQQRKFEKLFIKTYRYLQKRCLCFSDRENAHMVQFITAEHIYKNIVILFSFSLEKCDLNV